MLNLHKVWQRSRSNGPGTRYVVWVQGCPRSCPGCWNPESLPFVEAQRVSVDALYEQIIQTEGIDGVTFSGGEPFSQSGELAELARRLKEYGLSIVTFTGYTIEQLHAGRSKDWDALLAQIDLLIDGVYMRTEETDAPLKGSANQRLHFLTGVIAPEEVNTLPRSFDIMVGSDGVTAMTGFPSSAFKEKLAAMGVSL